jgi:hypothetical protein
VTKPYALKSLVFHVCLKLKVWKDVGAGQGCVEGCIYNGCDEQFRGPPAGPKDEEGFNVGYQALGNLQELGTGRVTVYQQPNLLQLTFRHCSSTGPATDVLTVRNSQKR